MLRLIVFARCLASSIIFFRLAAAAAASAISTLPLEMNPHLLLSLFHIFAVVPFFLYVALSKANTHPQAYQALFGLGIVLMIYQSYKAFTRYFTNSSYLWVNLLHVFIIAPLVIYIGVKGKETPRAAYEMLALISFAALGYHMYSLVLQANIANDEKK